MFEERGEGDWVTDEDCEVTQMTQKAGMWWVKYPGIEFISRSRYDSWKNAGNSRRHGDLEVVRGCS